MKLLKLRTLWGLQEFENPSADLMKQKLKQLKDQGFDGFEIAIQFFDEQFVPQLNSIRKDLGLSVITQIHTAGYPVKELSVQKHLDSFKNLYQKALLFEPVGINSHSGRDSWSESENLQFFSKVVAFEKNCTTKVFHETHRQRSFFNPFITGRILKEITQLKINLDYSHWVLCCQRLQDFSYSSDFGQNFQLIINQSQMIHARIGTPQQIQVGALKQSIYSNEINHFMTVWRQVIQQQINLQNQQFYVTTEFGPFPFYHPINVETGEQNGDPNTCNLQMLQLIQTLASNGKNIN